MYRAYIVYTIDVYTIRLWRIFRKFIGILQYSDESIYNIIFYNKKSIYKFTIPSSLLWSAPPIVSSAKSVWQNHKMTACCLTSIWWAAVAGIRWSRTKKHSDTIQMPRCSGPPQRSASFWTRLVLLCTCMDQTLHHLQVTCLCSSTQGRWNLCLCRPGRDVGRWKSWTARKIIMLVNFPYPARAVTPSNESSSWKLVIIQHQIIPNNISVKS